MQKSFHIIHRTELLPLFKKENKPLECVILLAAVREVKGGRWERARQRRKRVSSGSSCLAAVIPAVQCAAPGGDLSLQLCTDLWSVYRRVCSVQNSWAAVITHTSGFSWT